MKKRSTGKLKKRFVFMAAVLMLAAFGWWQNNGLVITHIDYANPKIPSDFHDFTIVQISDLHNKSFGKEQATLLRQVAAQSPDIIVITGDLIDRRRYNLETAVDFIHGAVAIAPTYFVSGNHEAWSGQYDVIKEQLIEAGVHVLDDDTQLITREDSAIRMAGLSDPAFLTASYLEGTRTGKMEDQLKKWTDNDAEHFTILLSHRPELFHLYHENNIDLTFTGHAHGGQFRLPFLGGLVAPDQGLFPPYTSGSHTHGSSTMVVSRGLGNSIIPLRVFNRPEIVVVTLQHQ
ncbi:metallophosphoesterase [Anoxynatronum buryatiense]|uniref:Calcineurin-like phosphoesterase domain-containing protein n=1 Tax=Anoxynatronum buryatiense TaxID=489973 RepID=A0AA46AIK9_9CLOT|nr:metallophosphoesterase [Anoxynatronum buryatiense]SMP50895.1 hypothetical protein SAMN06296020_10432 [Anoxynatronum buryatiense]